MHSVCKESCQEYCIKQEHSIANFNDSGRKSDGHETQTENTPVFAAPVRVHTGYYFWQVQLQHRGDLTINVTQLSSSEQAPATDCSRVPKSYIQNSLEPYEYLVKHWVKQW